MRKPSQTSSQGHFLFSVKLLSFFLNFSGSLHRVHLILNLFKHAFLYYVRRLDARKCWKTLILGRDRYSDNCLAPKMREGMRIWGVMLYADVFHCHLIVMYLGKIPGLVCFTVAVSLLPDVFVYPYKTSSLFCSVSSLKSCFAVPFCLS